MLFNRIGKIIQITLSEAVSQCRPRIVNVLSQPFSIYLSHYIRHLSIVTLNNGSHPVTMTIIKQDKTYTIVAKGTALNDFDSSSSMTWQVQQSLQIWFPCI